MNDAPNTHSIKASPRADNWQPGVSIIVLTFNSERTIKTCLDSICRLNYPENKLEIIIIDNGSTDGTLAMVEGYSFNYSVEPDARITEMRNLGARRAGGEVLGYVDSDCQIDPDWINGAIKHLADPGVGVAGCEYDIPENPNWVEKSWGMKCDQGIRQVNYVPAGNMMLRREVFEKVGGFDENLETGEDADLCARIKAAGYKIISDPEIRNVHWGNPGTLLAFTKKQIWHGKGMVRLLSGRNFLNKVFLSTNVFLFAHLAAFLVLVAPMDLNMKFPIVLVLALNVLFLCISAALYRCRQLKNFRLFVPLTIIWYSYFLGRSISLTMIYFRAIFARDSLTSSD